MIFSASPVIKLTRERAIGFFYQKSSAGYICDVIGICDFVNGVVFAIFTFVR